MRIETSRMAPRRRPAASRPRARSGEVAAAAKANPRVRLPNRSAAPRKPKPKAKSGWIPLQEFSASVGQQVHLKGTYKGTPAECVAQIQSLVHDSEGSWMKLALTGSPSPEIREWKRQRLPSEEFYANQKPLAKTPSPELDGLFFVQEVKEVDPDLEWKSNLVDLIRNGQGLAGLEGVARDLGYGVGDLGPPLPEAKAPGLDQPKTLKGTARVKAMVKDSMWSWRGSSLDPAFKRPKIGLKRNREASSSSSSASQASSRIASQPCQQIGTNPPRDFGPSFSRRVAHGRSKATSGEQNKALLVLQSKGEGQMGAALDQGRVGRERSKGRKDRKRSEGAGRESQGVVEISSSDPEPEGRICTVDRGRGSKGVDRF